MRWSTSLRQSCRALARSGWRTTLSAVGVAVGVASVALLIGAGAGADRALRESLAPLGRNLLVVNAARRESSALRGLGGRGTTLTVEDGLAVAARVPGVSIVAPSVEAPRLATAEGRAVPVRVNGTTPGFQQARSFPLVAGRFLDEEDLRESRRVAVVGAPVVEQLFEGEIPLGESLRIGGVPFRIVGVTRKKGVSSNGANDDELVMVPLTTAMRRLLDVDSLDRIYIQAESEEAVPVVLRGLVELLRRRHGVPAAGTDDFSVRDQTAIARAQREVSGPLSRVVPTLAALALGLGGVGLLAVCLLSVRERTSEIGLRLAVGGLPREILLQFLAEAVLVSILGGLLGLTVGAASLAAAAALTRWPMALVWQAFVYPFLLSVAIALVFGAYPAWRAARLDPIVALNHR